MGVNGQSFVSVCMCVTQDSLRGTVQRSVAEGESLQLQRRKKKKKKVLHFIFVKCANMSTLANWPTDNFV